jgi:predicted NAD/FAD-binding protein
MTIEEALKTLTFWERWAIRVLAKSDRIISIEIRIDRDPDSMILERLYHMPAHGEEDD